MKQGTTPPESVASVKRGVAFKNILWYSVSQIGRKVLERARFRDKLGIESGEI